MIMMVQGISMKASVIVIALLAGCSPQPAPYDYEGAVKNQLRDPESAQFSDVTVNVESACGFVNSKNGYGGYSGKKPFVAVGTENVRIIDGADKADAEVVAARCKDPALGLILSWMTGRAMEALK